MTYEHRHSTLSMESFGYGIGDWRMAAKCPVNCVHLICIIDLVQLPPLLPPTSFHKTQLTGTHHNHAYSSGLHPWHHSPHNRLGIWSRSRSSQTVPFPRHEPLPSRHRQQQSLPSPPNRLQHPQRRCPSQNLHRRRQQERRLARPPQAPGRTYPASTKYPPPHYTPFPPPAPTRKTAALQLTPAPLDPRHKPLRRNQRHQHLPPQPAHADHPNRHRNHRLKTRHHKPAQQPRLQRLQSRHPHPRRAPELRSPQHTHQRAPARPRLDFHGHDEDIWCRACWVGEAGGGVVA